MNIILFLGIILVFKTCVNVCYCNFSYGNKTIYAQTNYRNFNYIINEETITEPNFQNLPGIKVEPIQIRFVNEYKTVFFIIPNLVKKKSLKYTHLPTKIIQFTQRNLQVSYLKAGVLLI